MSFIINEGFYRVYEALYGDWADEYNVLTVHERTATIIATSEKEVKELATIEPNMEMPSGKQMTVQFKCDKKYAAAIQQFIESRMQSPNAHLTDLDKKYKGKLIQKWEQSLGQKEVQEAALVREIARELSQITIQDTGPIEGKLMQSCAKLNPIPQKKKMKELLRNIEIKQGLYEIYNSLYPTSSFSADLIVLQEYFMDSSVLKRTAPNDPKVKGKTTVVAMPIELPSGKTAHITLKCRVDLTADIEKFMKKIFPHPTIPLEKVDQGILEKFTAKLETLALEQEQQQAKSSEKTPKRKPRVRWADGQEQGPMPKDKIKVQQYFI